MTSESLIIITLIFSPSHCCLSWEPYSIGFCLFEWNDRKAFGSGRPAGNPLVTRGWFRQKGQLQIALQYKCLGVPCCTQIISFLIWQRLTRGLTRAWILNICRLSNRPFLNLQVGATCFRTEWRARANFRRLLQSSLGLRYSSPHLQTAEIQFRHCFAYKVYQLHWPGQCTGKCSISSTFVHKAFCRF